MYHTGHCLFVHSSLKTTSVDMTMSTTTATTTTTASTTASTIVTSVSASASAPAMSTSAPEDRFRATSMRSEPLLEIDPTIE